MSLSLFLKKLKKRYQRQLRNKKKSQRRILMKLRWENWKKYRNQKMFLSLWQKK